jgi:hypothetical protein
MRPNKALQQTAATGIALPGREVFAVAAAAELERSAGGRLLSLATASLLWERDAFDGWRLDFSIVGQFL